VGWWVKAIVDGLCTSSKGMNIVISPFDVDVIFG
jgi:quinolinate synthase